jgi:hypothetical protein
MGDGVAQVNLLLNRASPQLDLDSYLPYEGKAVVKNKTARTVHVRVPNWVSRSDVCCHVGANGLANRWLGNYLLFDDVAPGTQITIEFPMTQQTIERTFAPSGVTYSILRRGNTVLDISPRDDEAPQEVRDGGLVLTRGGCFTVAGLELEDAIVSVDVEVQAGATTEAGIVLRHQSDRRRVAAVYNLRKLNHEIGFEEDAAIGDWEPPLASIVIAEGLGDRIGMTVRMEGAHASLTVTDGTRTFTSSYEMRNRHAAGAVGVQASPATARPVRYTNFRVSDLDGNTIFHDSFDGPDGPPAGWTGYEPFIYRFYQRDHLRGNSAPMVKKTRFSPDTVIRP